MTDFLFLMHDDGALTGESDWNAYLAKLQQSGNFGGGSAIGGGECVNISGPARTISRELTGYIRVRAENISHARTLLQGKPVFEAGGTVEIRELERE